MDTDRWHRIKVLFDKALQRAPNEWDAFLRRACENSDLRHDVRSLLDAHATDGPADRLDEGLDAELHRRSLPPTTAGRRIGPYELVEELGHGGMGRVFLARRADAQFDQQVALKVLGTGALVPEARKRFLAERQILASLDHPNVARLLDGGVTDTGEPYFVMEAVDGQPLDQYADANGLSLEERLALFLDICDAVRSAHQQLIVHRDLKPENVLVTEEGTVKLLDFGVAKLLDSTVLRAQDAPDTRTGWHPMTPEYASPEQVRGGTITTASDIYQLGVLLYELLTGRRPHTLESRAPQDLKRTVCDEVPPRPSAVASPAEGQPLRTPPGQLRGDLDAIVMTALRKDPDRRYESVGALAQDVRRFRAGRPVSARPNTWTYRAGKFVRRHWSAVATAAIAVLLVIGYVATITWYSHRIQAALDRARAEAEQSDQVMDVLVDMFERADPYGRRASRAGHRDTLTTRELLDRGVARARTGLSGQPDVQAKILSTLGRIHRHRGHHETAESLLDKALALQEEHLPSTHPDRAESLHERARLLRYEGEMREAARLYRKSLSILRARYGDEHPAIADNLRELAVIAAREGRYADADSLFREALAMRTSLHGPDHPDVATELHALGLLYVLKDDLTEAERLLRRSLAIRRNHYDREHPHVAETLDRLGQVLVEQGKIDAAEPLMQEAMAVRRDLFQKNHPSRAVSLNNMGRLLRKKGEYTAAANQHRKAAAIYRQLYGPKNLDLANTLYERAEAERKRRAYAVAESLYYRAAAMQRSLHGPDHPSVQESLTGLSRLYTAWGRPEKADSVTSRLAAQASPQ